MSAAGAADLYCVFGNPVAHSKSPFIHARFALQTGQHIRYERELVEPGAFQAALDAFRRRGGRGCNVTVPFKQDAWRCARMRTARAERAGAANTLAWDDAEGAWLGDNTDGVGLLRDLRDNHGVQIRGRRVLVLGAGGAARGILAPLLAENPEALQIANRTPATAETLAAGFRDLGAVSGGGLKTERVPDILINATSIGVQGAQFAAGDIAIGPHTLCYDLSYASAAEPFARWARARGAVRIIDGLGMLVEQAAESFTLWRGVRPATGPVIRALREAQENPC
ncbi:MAG: shikimate dehydrogenase [Gammaproteobacteria bacterium]